MPRSTKSRAYALTAAARTLTGQQPLSTALLAKAIQASSPWQASAWGYYDDVPEIHFAHEFLGNCCGRMRLYAQLQANPTDPPIPLDPDDDELDGDVRKAAAVAAATLDRLDSSLGGMAGLQAALGLNTALTGEVYLWGHADDEAISGEVWEAISTKEVRVSGDSIQVVSEGATSGDSTVDVAPTEHFIRLWRRHPAYRLRADSPMRSLASTCDELLLLTRSVRAVATSRLAGAGLLKVPDELSFVAPSLDGGEPPEDGEDDPLLETLIINMTTPLANPESAAAVVPLMVKGPSEALKAMEHMVMDRPFDPLAIQLREEAVTRLARGLDIPPEILLGLADVNHWSAWQVEEQTFKAHVEPLVGLVVEGLTVGFLQPMLRDAGIALWPQISVGYDPSSLVGHPNEFPEAMQMHTAYAVSDAYLRAKGGAGDEDAPDEEELARRIAEHAAIPPEVTTALLRVADILPALEQAVGATPDTTPEAPGNDTAPEPPASPETTVPGPPEQPEEPLLAASGRRDLGGRLAALDRALMARVLALAEQTVQRAVEMIGARIIRAQGNAPQYAEARARIRDVSLERVAAVLGRDHVHRLGVREDEIMAKHLGSAEKGFRDSVRRTRHAARSAISDDFGEPPEGWDDDQWEQAQDDNDDRAWALLLAGMMAAAATALYNPRPDAPRLGEVPVEAKVEPGLVREALGVAGGEQPAPNVRPVNGPAGQVALGDSMLDLLHDAYAQVVTGWRWVYGDPGARIQPFEPHEDLDGVEFATWDADVLYNTEPFPETAFYAPGDHDGCQCDFEVVLGPGAP